MAVALDSRVMTVGRGGARWGGWQVVGDISGLGGTFPLYPALYTDGVGVTCAFLSEPAPSAD